MDETKLKEILGSLFDEKMPEIKASVLEELKRQKAEGVNTDYQDETKSLMNQDPITRKIAPFVKLSKKTEEFCRGLKSLAKTGYNAITLKAALNGESDDEGGFLVPDEIGSEIIRFMSESSIIRPRARIFKTAGDSYKLTGLDQSESTFGGIQLYWIGQSDLKQESEPKFTQIKLVLNKLIGLTAFTDELQDDAMVNVANFLVNLFGEYIAYEEDSQFISGNGVGKPMGIINSPLTKTVARATASEVNVQDFYNLDNQIPAHLDKGLVWIMAKATMNSLRGKRAEVYNGATVVETGQFLLQENYSTGAVPNILGRPVLISDKSPAKGTQGDIILANLKGYGILDKRQGAGIAITASIHDRFRYDEQTLRFVKRVDGQPIIRNAFAMLTDAS